jgi:hypothetical protein
MVAALCSTSGRGKLEDSLDGGEENDPRSRVSIETVKPHGGPVEQTVSKGEQHSSLVSSSVDTQELMDTGICNEGTGEL